jgi:hypothetical protein
MASTPSFTDVSRFSGSFDVSAPGLGTNTISISPTSRFHQCSAGFNCPFGSASPLLLNRNERHRVFTLIDKPSAPFDFHSFYFSLDESNHWFNLKGPCGVGRDAIILEREDGWKVIVPDKWYGELGWKLRIRRFLSHFCIGTYFTNDFME